MNTRTSTPSSRRLRAATALAVACGSGCSFAVGDAAPARSVALEPHLLYRVSERTPTAHTVTLLPQPLDRRAGGGGALDARLYVGGMAAFTDGPAAYGYGPNRLALVILAVSDSVRPMLADFRQLLLEIDGELYQTSPMPDPRLYSFGPTDLGHTETVVVPIDRELLTLIARAHSVRGRVGHWLAFDVPPDALDRLRELAYALPESFPSGRRAVALSPLHRATF